MSRKRRPDHPWDKERIRALRHFLGLTQKEMAERLGTDQQRVSEWERGAHRPSRITATLLSMVAERSGFVYPEESEEPAPMGGETLDQWRERPITALQLPPRVVRLLRQVGITQVGQVLDRFQEGEKRLLEIPGFGERSLEALRRQLIKQGLLYGGGTSSRDEAEGVQEEGEEGEE